MDPERCVVPQDHVLKTGPKSAGQGTNARDMEQTTAPNSLRCKFHQCQQHFGSEEELVRHVVRHTGLPAVYVCPECPKEFTTGFMVQRHYHLNHPAQALEAPYPEFTRSCSENSFRMAVGFVGTWYPAANIQ